MAQKKYYETTDFKDLQKKWYKKLEKSGFNNNDKLDTQDVPSQRFKVEPEFIEYFHYCEKYLASGALTDKVDLFIFEYHCLGYSNREIVELLEVKKLRHLKHTAVDERLLKILKKAGIRPVDFGKK